MAGKAAKRAKYFGKRKPLAICNTAPSELPPAVDPVKSVESAWEWLALNEDIEPSKPADARKI
jgi:hypothetical protein